MDKLALPDIFCPRCSALILDQPRCPHCGWERPANRLAVGALAWPQPADIQARLGGRGGFPPCQPALAGGLVCFGTEGGDLVALLASTGEEKWRRPLGAGLTAHEVAVFEQQFVVPVSDERDVQLAGGGRLQCWSLEGQLFWEYPVANFRVSSVCIANGRAYFCTADRRLHCYDIARGAEMWGEGQGLPLPQWTPAGPTVAGGLVYVAGGMSIGLKPEVTCLDAKTGELVWEMSLEVGNQFSPVFSNDRLYVGLGERHLGCLDAKAGGLLWQAPVGEGGYTSTPIVSDDSIFIGGKGRQADGRRVYALFALDLATGRELWRAPVPRHIRVPPVQTAASIVCGTDAGTLHAVNSRGELQWEYTVNPVSEHIRTQPLVSGLDVIFGTRNGTVHAVRCLPAQPFDPAHYDPLALRADAQWEPAVVIFALQGNLPEAARTYEAAALQSQDSKAAKIWLDKAAALFREAGALGDAARLAEARGVLPEAVELYAQAGDGRNEARTRLLQEDHLGAARVYELQLKDYGLAAQQYELGGDRASALRQYRKLGDKPNISRLSEGKDRIKDYVEWGDLAGAALEAAAQGEFILAADLYHRQDDFEHELQTLVAHARKAQSWERVPDLARKLGRFEVEAEAWANLTDEMAAAQAYHRAAFQRLQASPPDEAGAAPLFGRAMQFYNGQFDKEKYQECRSYYIRCAHLPWIELKGQPEDHFREGEFNQVRVIIRNVGYGLARDIRVSVGGSFEPRDRDRQIKVDGLKDQASTEQILYLKPRDGMVGKVWLTLEVAYRDRTGIQEFHDEHELTVQVHSHDSHITQPVAPIINLYGGDYVAKGDKKVVEGDELHPGAHKGDIGLQRVGGDATPGHVVWSEPGREAGHLRKADESTLPCPVCGLPVPQSSNFCQACGHPMAPDNLGEKT